MPQDTDSVPPGAPDEQGRMLQGRYRIERVLGHGGMGEVFLAQDTLLGRRVALKRVHPESGDRSEARRAILREARRASQISDRHVAAIHDVLELEDDVVIVMEYVDGMTLRHRMADPVSLDDFWDLATQCVEGVAAAHAHSVIHRDLKPENLMLTRDGQVRILDFGIARRSGTGGPSMTSSDLQTLGVAGTPQYMAPEAHLGRELDGRTDIFSLGVVFYELLTSRTPFPGPTYAAVVGQILNAPPTPVHELNPAAGVELSRIIGKMLARDLDERYISASALMQDLAAVRRGAVGVVPAPAATPAPAPAGRRLRAAGVPALVILVLAVAAALVGGGWKRLMAPGLPAMRNLAVLAPVDTDSSDAASFALGFTDLLNARLHRHVMTPGFQMTSFTEGRDEHVRGPDDARKVLGANLALMVTLDQDPDLFRARLDLFETRQGRKVASHRIEMPRTQPFELLDRSYREAATMLRLKPRAEDAASATGVRGAGTLRYELQGMGRRRMATTASAAIRAAQDFEMACRTEPDAAAPRAGLAMAQRAVYLLGGDPEWLARATATAREAVALDTNRAESQRVLGSVLTNARDHQGALMAYARAVDLDPSDDEACLLLARTHARLGEREKERDAYLATIRRRPHCWQPYWWLATWYFRDGKVDESVRTFEEMIRRSPDLYKGYTGLGGVLVQRGDYGRAIDSLKKSVELRPTMDAFQNLGTAYFNTGRFAEAVDAYNQSFQFGNADYVVWLNLGDAYYWLRDRKDQAAQSYAQAVRLGRDEIATRAKEGRTRNVIIGADLATIFPKLGQPDSARVYLARAVASDSANPMVQYAAALTHWELDEKPKAVEWIARAVKGGYPVTWLRDSPIFHEWREVPEFRALVGEANAAPPPAASHKRGG